MDDFFCTSGRVFLQFFILSVVRRTEFNDVPDLVNPEKQYSGKISFPEIEIVLSWKSGAFSGVTTR